jgi:acyl-CoA reductase-like NAD-dependent aldehyde dehydrogenase
MREGSPVDVADTVNAELDRLISRRASQDRPDPAEQNALWKASVQRHNARRNEELRAAWCEYHQRQAERHRAILEALVEHHERRAEELAKQTRQKGTP